MVDAVAIFPPGFRALDSSGVTLPGAYFEFYVAGTETPKTVYSDSGLTQSLGTTVYTDAGGAPVASSGSSTNVIVYTGTAAYKIVGKTAAGVVVPALGGDNIKGAATIPTTSSSALPTTPVVVKTSAYSIVTGDRGKVINGNCTGGAFALTLPSAVTAGDNFRVCVRHTGTANALNINTVASQTISRSGKTSTAFALTSYGESVWLVSDGANWHVDSYVPPLMHPNTALITITDRLTAPPGSPTAGARYIINGTPSGAWSSYAQHDVVESDGNGSWIKYTPAAGWMAWVVDETLMTIYHTAAWNDQTGMAKTRTATLPRFIAVNSQADGTGGGTATSGAWTAIPLTATETVASEISGASLASNQITLPVGSYRVFFTQPFYGTFISRARFKSTTTATVIYSDTVQAGILASGPLDIATNGTAIGSGDITVSGSPETFALEYFVSSTRNTNGLGVVSGSTGVTETYARVEISSLVVNLA